MKSHLLERLLCENTFLLIIIIIIINSVANQKVHLNFPQIQIILTKNCEVIR